MDVLTSGNGGDGDSTVCLRDVLRLLGPGLLQPVLLPRGEKVNVAGVGVYDAATTMSRTDQITMAIGVQPSGLTGRALIEWCRQAGVAAVVIKADDGDLASLTDAASTHHVSVLRTPRDVDWADLLTEIRGHGLRRGTHRRHPVRGPGR